MESRFLNTLRRGFTLIELLVVIAIIGVLSSVVLVSLDVARERAKTTTAQAELNSIRIAITMLANDTGKGPNACIYPENVGSNGLDMYLTDGQAGLIRRPSAASLGMCSWTVRDVSNWNGPYVSSTIDPWGNAYFYMDHIPYSWCPSKANLENAMIIGSAGPDGDIRNDCDNVWLEL